MFVCHDESLVCVRGLFRLESFLFFLELFVCHGESLLCVLGIGDSASFCASVVDLFRFYIYHAEPLRCVRGGSCCKSMLTKKGVEERRSCWSCRVPKHLLLGGVVLADS